VRCDSALRVEGAPRVVAVGDVARFADPRYDATARRVERWCIPTDTAGHAARTLVAALAGEEPDAPAFAPLPSFWSDQRPPAAVPRRAGPGRRGAAAGGRRPGTGGRLLPDR